HDLCSKIGQEITTNNNSYCPKRSKVTKECYNFLSRSKTSTNHGSNICCGYKQYCCRLFHLNTSRYHIYDFCWENRQALWKVHHGIYWWVLSTFTYFHLTLTSYHRIIGPKNE